MGDQCPSPAPPCPQTPGPGLAAFCTNPSLDWVSPVAPAENTVRAMQYLFFSLDFSSILPLNRTLGFYLLSGSPHYDLTVCLPNVRSTDPSLQSTLTPQPTYRTRVQHCHSTCDSSAVPINHSTILCSCLTRSVFSTNLPFPVHGCPYMSA